MKQVSSADNTLSTSTRISRVKLSFMNLFVIAGELEVIMFGGFVYLFVNF